MEKIQTRREGEDGVGDIQVKIADCSALQMRRLGFDVM